MFSPTDRIAEPVVLGRLPQGPAGPAVMALNASVHLVAALPEKVDDGFALVDRSASGKAADELAAQVGGLGALRPLAPLAGAEALLTVREPLVAPWFQTLLWVHAWCAVPASLEHIATDRWVAERSARRVVRDIEVSEVPAAVLRRGRTLVAEIKAGERLNPDVVAGLASALESVSTVAVVTTLHAEQPVVSGPRDAIESGQRAVLLELAGLGPQAMRCWRVCAEAWRTVAAGDLAEMAEACARRAGRSVVKEVVEHRQPDRDRVALAADSGTRLDTPSSVPLLLDVIGHDSDAPAAQVRVEPHAGWLRITHVSGRPLTWEPTDEVVDDLAIERDVPADLEQLGERLRFLDE